MLKFALSAENMNVCRRKTFLILFFFVSTLFIGNDKKMHKTVEKKASPKCRISQGILGGPWRTWLLRVRGKSVQQQSKKEITTQCFLPSIPQNYKKKTFGKTIVNVELRQIKMHDNAYKNHNLCQIDPVVVCEKWVEAFVVENGTQTPEKKKFKELFPPF